MAKTFNEAFRDARAAGLSEFTWEGNRYSTRLADEPSSELTASERLQQAIDDYEDNYMYRQLADVEYRADIDPVVSRSPMAMLGYEDIRQKSNPSGDVGDYITHVLEEPRYRQDVVIDLGGSKEDAKVADIISEATKANNPEFPLTTGKESYILTPMSDLNVHGLYISKDQTEDIIERLKAGGINPGEIFINQPLGEIEGSYTPEKVVGHELGHAGADLLGNPYNEEVIMRMIDENPRYYTDDMLYKDLDGGFRFAKDREKETLRRLEKKAVKELIERGVPMVPQNADLDMQYGEPFFENPREDNFIQKFLRLYKGPKRKEIDKRYRYAEGGIVSLLGKD